MWRAYEMLWGQELMRHNPNMKYSHISLPGLANVRHETLSKKPSGRLATKVWPTTRSAERKRASIRVLLLPGSTRHRASASCGESSGDIMKLGNVATKWLQLCCCEGDARQAGRRGSCTLHKRGGRRRRRRRIIAADPESHVTFEWKSSPERP